jgi:hypothetical protein
VQIEQRRGAGAGSVVRRGHAQPPLAARALLDEAREQREVVREVREH